jgi:cysteinyl-tRNA synthetase
MKWSAASADGFGGTSVSAMARKHLGDEIDIHTGGEDNVFRAMSARSPRADFTGGPSRATGCAKFLQVDGGKVSKPGQRLEPRRRARCASPRALRWR